MNKEYLKPTGNMSSLMRDKALIEMGKVLISMEAAIKNLLADNTYIAIQSGVLIDTPEDFGVVRYAAHLKKDYLANPEWTRLSKVDQEADRYVKYLEKDPYVQVTVNIPGLCQLIVTANVRSDGKFVRDSVKADLDGALATLTFVDILETINSVKTVGLLTAPQYVEKLD